MKKRAFSIYDPVMSSHSLADLYLAIRRDAGLPPFEKDRLINQLRSVTGGAGPGTPLSALTYGGLGGMLGWLISKYFGMGPVGQIVSTAAGFGLGKTLNAQLNRPKNTLPGWKLL